MRLCIFVLDRGSYSETFIRAHLEFLPCERHPFQWGLMRPRLLSAARQAFSTTKTGLLGRMAGPARSGLRTVRLTRFRRFLRSRRIDAVLAEYGTLGAEIAEACAHTRIPLVVHFHGHDAYCLDLLEEYGERYRRMFTTARKIVAVSRDMERQLVSLGAPPEKVVYNPYGVDPAVFRGANPGAAPPHFIGVGRFIDKKAPHLTILAFAEVARKVPEARLELIGDGPLQEACRLQARSLGIEGAVTFPGVLPHAEVQQRMQAARALVQHSLRPSHGDSEGTPLSILEAGASGLPVVSTYHAGIPDVVLDGETGLLVEEGDVEGMARRMVQLAKDPALAARLGAAARERVRSNFVQEDQLARLVEIIRRARHERDQGL